MDNIQVKEDKQALWCNCKWEEAKDLLKGGWECYMELGKELRELKEGTYKGQFTAWCNRELEFSYDWANILIKAYSRYELSEFKDQPETNIQYYAEPQLLESTPHQTESETEDNMPKEKQTKQNSAKVMTPIDVWCEGQGLDDLQTEIAKTWYKLSKRIVKKYGVQAIDEAVLLINDNSTLYKL